MKISSSKPSTARGDALVAFAMLIFGAYALFINLLPRIPVVSFLFAMQAVGAIAFLILAWRQGFPKLNAKNAWLLVLLAITATANDLLYFEAFRFTSVANASVAHQMVSVYLLFLVPMFLGTKTKKNEWIALAIALAGVFILFRPGFALSFRDAAGIGMGLLSGLFYAAIVLIYKYLPQQGLSISFMNFVRYTLSAVMLLPAIPFFGGFQVIADNSLQLALFGLLFAVIASGIHNFGLSLTEPLHGTILGKSEPVIATFYAFLFLHQTPPFAAIVGGILIVGASTWLAFTNPKGAGNAATEEQSSSL